MCKWEVVVSRATCYHLLRAAPSCGLPDQSSLHLHLKGIQQAFIEKLFVSLVASYTCERDGCCPLSGSAQSQSGRWVHKAGFLAGRFADSSAGQEPSCTLGSQSSEPCASYVILVGLAATRPLIMLFKGNGLDPRVHRRAVIFT